MHVDELLASRARLEGLVAGCPAGPLHDRLASLRGRVEAAIETATTIATHAQTAERTVSSLNVDKVRDQLKDARRRLARVPEGSPDRMRIAEEERLLGEQHASLNQLANAIDEAGDRLRLLDLRLDTAVARAAQIALRPDALEALGDVDKELDGVVTELDALRAGLDAVGSLGP